MLLSRQQPWRQRLRQSGPMLLALLLAVIVVQGFILVTDPVKDRPATPFGFTGGCTHLWEVWQSHDSIIWRVLGELKLAGEVPDAGEGNAYLGMVVVLTLIVVLIRWATVRFRKGQRGGEEWLDVWPRPFVFLALLSLIVALGIPLVWGLEWTVPYLPLVKQFRTLGRFSWIFYHISAVYAAVVTWRCFERELERRRPVRAYAFISLVFAFWLLDVNGYLLRMRADGVQFRENYDYFFSTQEPSWPAFLQQHGYQPANFQAILMLPYFHIGTEKIWTGSEGPYGMEMMRAAKASIALRLPVMDVMLSRSSWGQAVRQIKTGAGPYADKPVLRMLPDRRPLLLMVFEGTELDDDQRYLLAGADSIGHHSGCAIYACYPDRVLANDRRQKAALLPVIAAMKGGDTCLPASASWGVRHFEEDGKYPFFGRGAHPTPKVTDTVLADMPVHPDSDTGWYETSVWALLPAGDYRNVNFMLTFLDSAGNTVFQKDMPSRFAMDGEGLWFRASRYFRMPAATRTLRLSIMPPDEGRAASVAVDEWQLRPRQAVVVSKDAAGRVMVNNHFLK